MKSSVNHFGFTLIELVVVMAVLSVLIVAVVALLNPIEQIRKSSDAAKQAQTHELISALTRYHLNKNYSPWNATPAIPGCSSVESANQNTMAISGTVLSSIPACIDAVTSAGELNTQFMSNPDIANSLLLSDETPTSPDTSKAVVCFKPESDSLKKSFGTIYTGTGYKRTTGCMAYGGADECYWCMR